MAEDTINFTGKSGTNYTLFVNNLDTILPKFGGVYLFVRKDYTNHYYNYVYLGITKDLSTRFDSHHDEKCIINNNATHICIMFEKDEYKRKFIEKDLLAVIDTPCNDISN